MRFFEHVPTILQLFEFFWPFNLMPKIVIEANCYATERIDVAGNTQGGIKWENLTVAVGSTSWSCGGVYI
jgi:hypothetical protein